MTQNEMVLQHLKAYGSITPKEAMDLYAVMRLGARIHELKKDGHRIQTTNEKAMNRFGDPVHFARYRLVEKHEDY